MEGSKEFSTSAGLGTADVCVVLYEPDLALLEATLASVVGQHGLRFLRLHINGGTESKDAIVSRVPGSLKSRLVLTFSLNIGFAAGQNRLLSDSFETGATHALVLNPDLTLEQHALGTLLVASGKLGDLHLLSGITSLGDRMTGPTGRIDSAGTVWTNTSRHLDLWHGESLALVGSLDGVYATASISGALMLVPRAPWQRLSSTTGEFFDEDFFAYREDAELGLRASALGIGSYVIPEVVGCHYRGTPGVSRRNALVNRLGVRNRFLLKYKWGGDRPGGSLSALVRDQIVLAGVLVRERSSFPGYRDARGLKPIMASKRELLRHLLRRPTETVCEESWNWSLRGVAEKPVDLHRYESRLSDIAIVIPVLNPPSTLNEQVRKLANAFTVVLVSDAFGASRPIDLVAGVQWIDLGRNSGIATALNVGVSYALSLDVPFILTLDQDTAIGPDSIRGLKDEIERSVRWSDLVVGPGMVSGAPYRGQKSGRLLETTELLQSGLLAHRDTYLRYGLFDERLFIDGVDTEYCLRLRSHGVAVCAVPHIPMEHRLGDTERTRVVRLGPWSPTSTNHSATRRYYMNRNRLVLIKRYWRHEPRWALVTLRRTVAGNLMAFTIEGDRWRKLGSTVSAVRDAVNGRGGKMHGDITSSGMERNDFDLESGVLRGLRLRARRGLRGTGAVG